MLALLITAAIATAPSDGGTHAAFRATSAVASASVTVRIVEAATINFDEKKPEGGGHNGGGKKHHRTLLINGEQLPATLVEFP